MLANGPGDLLAPRTDAVPVLDTQHFELFGYVDKDDLAGAGLVERLAPAPSLDNADGPQEPAPPIGRGTMREWFAIYGDEARRNAELVIRGDLKAPEYGGFRNAAKSRAIDGRALVGMYIVEWNDEHRKVIIYCGPIEQSLVHGAYISERTIKLW